jgi:hypothetical protein
VLTEADIRLAMEALRDAPYRGPEPIVVTNVADALLCIQGGQPVLVRPALAEEIRKAGGRIDAPAQ